MALPALQAVAQERVEYRTERSLPLKFGVKAGLNVANITIDNSGQVQNKQAIASFNAGVYGDLALLPILSIQPGLSVSGKGSKFVLGEEGSNNYTRVSTRPVYVELPVNLLLKLPLIKRVKLFFGAGPYFAMGVGGRNKVDGKALGQTFSSTSKIKYSSNSTQHSATTYEGNFKLFDAGFNILGGIEISRLTLNAGYGYGVVNTKPGTENGVNNKYQNRVVTIQLGLLL
ncbi:hypothetical protein GCM10023092_22670 [Rurimicrobium arvi]|uniref:Outer membrane protein beta-barrel domain-containing protein n=2 Tax=Rurimicrobium arvi TaxID=2049916 RepID=A0ABP8MZ21_9BACT